jgi:hypothetical protein
MDRSTNTRLGRVRNVRACLAAACVLVHAVAAAQAVTGTLVGNVTDQSGLPIARATVELLEINTGISTSTSTNDVGLYAASLKDGSYRIRVEFAGFKTAVRSAVGIPVNATVRVDFRLVVGDVQEAIVVAPAVQLQTDRADTGRILTGSFIQQLPLGFNRNFQAALVTIPGATLPFRPHSEFFNMQDSLAANVNGQPRVANSVQIDGVDNNQRTGLLTVLIPAIDAIESLSVSTSNYDVEFGRAGGAIANVTLKSGTNRLSGSVFALGNTEATIASGYFSRSKPTTDYAQGGFVVGGPLRRNRSFFFGDYQYTLDSQGRISRAVTPPLAFRNGDFSAAPTVIYDPRSGNSDGSGRQPFAGNVIPADRISPIARAILARLPAPNINAAAGLPNHEVAFRRDKRTHSFDVKITQQLTAADQASARFSFQRPTIVDPPVFGLLGGGGKSFAGVGTNLTYSTGANYNKVWTSTLTMEVRGGLSYYHNEAKTAGAGHATATELGIAGANLDEWTSGMSLIDIAGFTSPLVGFDPSLPWDRSERTTQLASVFNRLAGNHLVKIGADVRQNRDFLLQTQDNGGSRGRFQFRAPQTAAVGDPAAQGGFANAFAAFLLDVPVSMGRDLKVLDSGTRHWEVFTFIQDKWTVFPRLTVDYGLRHEYYSPLVGLTAQGGLSNYDPVTNTLRVAGYGDVDDAVGVRSYYKNFAPRTGASFRLNERSVLRGGYGVSTVPFPDNAYAFNVPVRQSVEINAPNSFAAAGSMSQGFPPPAALSIPASGIIDASTSRLANMAFTYVPPDLHEGSVHSWNLAYQRELPDRWVVEAAYVGNRGVDVLATINMNAATVLGADNAGRPLFPTFGRTAEVMTWVPVKSRYDGLQVKLDRRLSDGLSIAAAYTLGRGKNYSNGDSNGAIQTPADRERSWARRGEDRLHDLAVSWVYQFPAPGWRGGVLAPVLRDWQISGIWVVQSGLPIDFTAANATLRAPGNRQRPNVSGRPAVLGAVGSGQQWFDASVFSTPATATWGNVRRNSLLDGPGYQNVDAALVRTFAVQRVRAELRVDAFNVFNTPHFNNPDGNLGNATFGQITSVAFGSERLVRFAFRVAF